MSLVKKQAVGFSEIRSYLANHPDFFTEHPEVLKFLSIPHDIDPQHSGQNVSSFLEYQAIHLQKQLYQLEKQNQSMEETGEEQRRLIRDIHTFVMHLMQARTLGKFYLLLQRGLRKYYAADRTVVLIFVRTGLPCDETDLRFLDPSSSLYFMFTELFHREKPLCNSLQEEHLEAIFKQETGNLHSTVMLPMADGKRRALMILGSGDKNRYQQGIELDLLLFISQVVNFKISSFLG